MCAHVLLIRKKHPQFSVLSQLFCPQEAQAAQKQGHNHKLDKNHTFSVSMFDDFERYDRIPEEYEEPTLPEYEEKVGLD